MMMMTMVTTTSMTSTMISLLLVVATGVHCKIMTYAFTIENVCEFVHFFENLLTFSISTAVVSVASTDRRYGVSQKNCTLLFCCIMPSKMKKCK